MPLIQCPDCRREHSDAALTCPQCGRPAAVEAREPRRFLAPTLFAIAVLIGAGNFRFVSGTDQVVIRRQTFGYSDAFASVQDCTSAPWIAASAAHGPLCADLQAAGILESDAARNARVQREVMKNMEDAQRRVTEMLRR